MKWEHYYWPVAAVLLILVIVGVLAYVKDKYRPSLPVTKPIVTTPGLTPTAKPASDMLVCKDNVLMLRIPPLAKIPLYELVELSLEKGKPDKYRAIECENPESTAK